MNMCFFCTDFIENDVEARPAARFDKTPATIDVPATKPGEHSRDILEELGYSAENIDKLISAKAVKSFGE